MRLNLTLMIFISLIFIGCGQKKSKPTSIIYIGQEENLSTYTENLTVDFSSPEGLGTLITLHEGMNIQRNVSFCTWFLVDKNLAMTNSHCIPEAIKKDNKLSCGDYLQGGIKTQSGIIKVRCKKLIHASDISQSTLLNDDYALIELEKSIDNAFTFKLDRKGVAENEKIKILTLNHQQNSHGIYSSYKERNCMMKSSNMWGKINYSGASPLVGFKEEGTNEICKTIHGNSGSPVTDESGRLIGILHGGIKEGFDLNQGMKFSSSEMTNDLSILTNFRCQKFNDSVLDADYPESCANKKQTVGLDNEKLLDELELKIRTGLDDTLTKQPTYFEYNIEAKSQANGKNLISIMPKCIKSLNQWDEKSLNEVVESRFPTKTKKITAVIGLYMMEKLISLDYYGNFSIDVKLKVSGNIQLNITGLDQLDKKKQVSSVVTSSLHSFKDPTENIIKKCE